jgi:hypothetical protein
MIGDFLERESDPHVSLRRRLIEQPSVLPESDAPTMRARAVDVPGPAVDALFEVVAKQGLGVLHLDEPLSNEHFRALGARFGTAMPETDPAVRPHVEEDVVLNLVSAQGHTSDVSRQPFAINALSLHTEGSGRATHQQPRYIILMCCSPGGDATAAQTVLVPMVAVHDRLSGHAAALLTRTRYRTMRDVPWVLRREEAGPVFSFRDFQQQPLKWEHDEALHLPDDAPLPPVPSRRAGSSGSRRGSVPGRCPTRCGSCSRRCTHRRVSKGCTGGAASWWCSTTGSFPRPHRRGRRCVR